jgi:hypothetical protein
MQPVEKTNRDMVDLNRRTKGGRQPTSDVADNKILYPIDLNQECQHQKKDEEDQKYPARYLDDFFQKVRLYKITLSSAQLNERYFPLYVSGKKWLFCRFLYGDTVPISIL